MPLQYANLDHITRRAMVEELDEDIANGTMHISPRLQPTAVPEYQRLVRDALRYYDDLWLEERIAPLLVDFETRHTPKGEMVTARLPEGAARVMAERDSCSPIFARPHRCRRLHRGWAGQIRG